MNERARRIPRLALGLAIAVTAALAFGGVARAGDTLVASWVVNPSNAVYQLPLGAAGYNTTQVAQDFSPSQTGTLSHIDLMIANDWAWGPPGPTEVELVNAPGYYPTGSVIASTVIPGGALPSLYFPPPFYSVTFAAPVTLNAGSIYAFVIIPLAPPASGTTLSFEGPPARPSYPTWEWDPARYTWDNTYTHGDVDFRVWEAGPTDTVPPTTTDNAPSSWQNHDVTVTLTATDGGEVPSGVAATYWSLDGGSTNTGTSVPVAGDGTHTLTYWSVDKAGNTETPHSATVEIDETPPSLQVSHTPDGLAGWNVHSPVSESVSAGDSGSGLAGQPSCTVDGSSASLSGGAGSWTLTLTGEGVHAVACSVGDLAGNSTSAADTVEIDTVPPVVTFSGDAGTYGLMDTVSITCAASDPAPGSGLGSTTCTDVGGSAWSFGAGPYTLSASATDIAGNVGNGSATFTVVVTADGLCSLTRSWSSNAGVANSACEQLGVGNNGARRPNVSQFDRIVAAQAGKAITSAQAARLEGFAAAL